MKYISLFAGIGGFELALNRLGHECVYVNEWDKYAALTYEKNFGHKPDTRDITTVSTTEIPDHDILVGGFPCQAFSIAGRRLGFAETRGTLFFDIARILRDKRPRYFLLENVKGLLNHDSGKTLQTIFGVLSELGYEFEWQILNSKNFGLAQNRERILIAGYIRGEARPKVFPLIGDDGENHEASQEIVYWKNSKEKWVDEKRRLSPTLKTHSDLVKRPLIKRLDVDSAHYQDRVYGTDGLSPTLPTGTGGNHQPKIISGVRLRRLTPIECERLQGFPDNWTEGVSETQRYKQLGNAVSVNVIFEVAKRLWK